MSALPFVIAAVVWAPLSFLLHNVIHEGAHALAALWAGSTSVRLYPFPSKLTDGRWSWAHMDYEPPRSLSTDLKAAARLKWLSVAPVIAEVVWWHLAILALVRLSALSGPAADGLHLHWWAALVVVECISPLVDCVTWVLPWWRKDPHPFTDAEVHRSDWGFRIERGRLWSLLLLSPSAVTVSGLISRW